MHAIGIDIGGTKIAGAVVDESGTVIAEERVATVAGESDAVIDAVVDMVTSLSSGRDIIAAGVAAPGFIDSEQSTVYYTPNIAWRNEPLKERLAARLGIEITIDNDANAAGWAEYRFGAGRGFSDMTMLTIGTGVGGAVVSHGSLFRGGFGAAGELGHMRVVPEGLPCGCGARGCIEQYGSGRALLRMAGEIADVGGVGLALAEARRQHGELTGTIVGELIAAGDPGALHALEQLGHWLGQACASLSPILDPHVFVFGGGVSVSGDLLLDPVKESFRQHVPARGYRPEPEFRIAELVNDAGMVGAADLARLHATAR
ncbi:glucokinase [Microbacteriaceae bacterium SG_E_30_P1]|uniref:Glucokinase n=1 Tax=Antiquaquibacter oligotrophicus TaxID=2880260 RepID=A0ABT6KMZ1_9MICO|nr:ROK family glucokinase [Antiquaquibacter oligotrophicus]MDH6180803.1 glucokinase [Antiquaquibacter oligotrophicus]UDF13479.1 ROK family glucokinase [Antiquaquibacter oligotrophicus]